MELGNTVNIRVKQQLLKMDESAGWGFQNLSVLSGSADLWDIWDSKLCSSSVSVRRCCIFVPLYTIIKARSLTGLQWLGIAGRRNLTENFSDKLEEHTKYNSFFAASWLFRIIKLISLLSAFIFYRVMWRIVGDPPQESDNSGIKLLCCNKTPRVVYIS